MESFGSSYGLRMLGLPVIATLNDFSHATHISKNTIYQLSKNSSKHYLTFEVSKKSGGKRPIAQPSRRLKGLQVWILRNILDKLKVSSSCKGFEKGSSTAANVSPHVGANIVINLDLEDFFGNIDSVRIYYLFRALGYNSLISTIFANVCTFEDGLPQGSPCSPRLANLVAWKLDARIQGYVGRRGVTYTRYADDMSFSGINPLKACKTLPIVKKIIENEGFILNEKKTRVAGSSKRKKITGLVLSEGSFGIGSKQYKILRAKVHKLSNPENANDYELIANIKGWIAYLKSVDGVRHKRIIGYIETIIGDNSESHLRTLVPTYSPKKAKAG